jgi:hypothetical protein
MIIQDKRKKSYLMRVILRIKTLFYTKLLVRAQDLLLQETVYLISEVRSILDCCRKKTLDDVLGKQELFRGQSLC